MLRDFLRDMIKRVLLRRQVPGILKDFWRFMVKGALSLGQGIGFIDHVPAPRGWVKCWVEDFGGPKDLVFSQELHHSRTNLIVTLARKAMTHLVAEGGTAYQIVSFQAGTGGHAPGDPLTPIDPSLTDTALETTYFTKAITLPPVYAPVGEESNVTLTLVMETTEGNGGSPIEYTEAGLFCTNGTLFARQTFPAVVKTNTRRITFEWILYF